LDLNSDRYLTAVDVTLNQPLVANTNNYTNTVTFKLPTDLTSPYYIIVLADGDRSRPAGAVYEPDDNNNNLASTVFNITVPPPADLQVTNVTVASGGKVGGEIAVEWTVQNFGNLAKGRWRDALYLSADGILDINDRLFGTFDQPSIINGNLENNAAYTNRQNVSQHQRHNYRPRLFN
jgi:hypothetical protein